MSVLGKRTRHSVRHADFTELPVSSKRRATFSSQRKQDNILFKIHQDGEHPSDADYMDVDERVVLCEEQENGKRDVLSPTKANPSRQAHHSPDVREQEQRVQCPRTPRHRDAPSKRHPVTPRHRVRLGGAPLTPRTPRTPQQTSTQTFQPRSIYQRARCCFFDSSADLSETRQMIGREDERKELQNFISKRLAAAKSGALYVSGPPGTGKSALISEVTRESNLPTEVKYTYLNCMGVKSANDVYTILLSELGISDNVFDARPREVLAKAMLSDQGRSTYFVVLDEIDALLDLDVTALYNMFDWALHASSRLTLVGIANALDLTDRFLPNLRARGLKPQLLPFLPYTSSDISSVLTARLRTLLPENSRAQDSFTPVLMAPAIQLIAKKVAAQTGDLRKAFDIAQKTIGMIEAETKQQLRLQQDSGAEESPSKTPLGENTNLSSPRSEPQTPTKPQKHTSTSLNSFTAENAPRASISHVVRITSAAFNNGTKERLLSLNLQQKAILCSLAALEQHNQRAQTADDAPSYILSQPRTGLLPSPNATPSKKRARIMPSTPTKRECGTAPSLRDVFEAYARLCRHDNTMCALSYSEFRDVVSNLETMGLLNAADGKAGSFAQVVTPSRKGRAGGGMGTLRTEERRVHGTAGADELKGTLENAGAVKAVLTRMLEGRDL